MASETELLIACSTSAVAVCRSRASLVSLNRRAFWIAITAWSAKVRSRPISLSLKPTGGWRITYRLPIDSPSHSIGAMTCE